MQRIATFHKQSARIAHSPQQRLVTVQTVVLRRGQTALWTFAPVETAINETNKLLRLMQPTFSPHIYTSNTHAPTLVSVTERDWSVQSQQIAINQCVERSVIG